MNIEKDALSVNKKVHRVTYFLHSKCSVPLKKKYEFDFITYVRTLMNNL